MICTGTCFHFAGIVSESRRKQRKVDRSARIDEVA
jgi:hypothetical protein